MSVQWRRLLVVLLVFLLAAVPVGVVQGQSLPLSITQPVTGTVWTAGSTVTIQWTGGAPGWNVNLALIDVPTWTTVQSIASGVPNSGTYTWTIPPGVPSSTYQVYVEEVGKKDWAYSGDIKIVPARPDLAIRKRALGRLVAGQQATYHIAVSNVGSAPAPGPIVVTDTLGTGLTYVSATGGGWTCSAAGATVTCTHPGPLPAATSLPPITLTVAVAAGVDAVENCAAVQMRGKGDHPGEENFENNRTCVENDVQAPAGGQPCCLTLTVDGGRADNFQTADGPEPATPPPGAPAAFFDEVQIDRRLDHRFTLPDGNCIRRATLEVRVRPLWSSLSSNDTIGLSSGTGTPVQWGSHFGAGSWGTGLVANAWTQANYPAGQTFTLDLAALPGGGSLLAALNSSRYLDLGIQDDTSVDYARLTVQFCTCREVGPGTGPVPVPVPAPGPKGPVPAPGPKGPGR